MACDPELSQVLLSGLPPLFKVSIRNDASGRWLENSIRFSVNEADAVRAGGEAVLAKLSEVLFVQTLRAYIAQLPADQTGWLAGARDAEVGKTLALMHRNPPHPWTIASLAKEAGVSRSVLAYCAESRIGSPAFGSGYCKNRCARPEDVAAGRFRPPASLGPRIGGRLDQESLHFVHFWNVELRHGADLLEHLPH